MSEYLTVTELSKYLKVSEKNIKNWVRVGSIPSITLPTGSKDKQRYRRLFRIPEIQVWLEENRVKRYNVPTMGLYRREKGKNKSGVWLYSFHAGGQRVFGSTGEIDKQKAFEVFTRKYQEFLEGKWQTGPGISMGKMIDKYLAWSRATHTPRTHTGYKSVAKGILKHFGANKRLSSIMAQDIEQYKVHKRDRVAKETGRPNKVATVNRHLTFLQGLFTKALQWGHVKQSPFQFRSIRKFKEEAKPERYLTAQERNQLIEACGDNLRPIVLFALSTGMRAGEILSLEWKNVNFGKRIIFVENTKAHKVRHIFISEKLAEMLKRFPKYGPLVFCHEDGKPRTVAGLGNTFEAAVLRAGVQWLTFHDLRHNFALSFLEGARSATAIYDLQRILGHTSLVTTQRYLATLDKNVMQGMEGVSAQIGPKVWGKVWGMGQIPLELLGSRRWRGGRVDEGDGLENR